VKKKEEWVFKRVKYFGGVEEYGKRFTCFPTGAGGVNKKRSNVGKPKRNKGVVLGLFGARPCKECLEDEPEMAEKAMKTKKHVCGFQQRGLHKGSFQPGLCFG